MHLSPHGMLGWASESRNEAQPQTLVFWFIGGFGTLDYWIFGFLELWIIGLLDILCDCVYLFVPRVQKSNNPKFQ